MLPACAGEKEEDAPNSRSAVLECTCSSSSAQLVWGPRAWVKGGSCLFCDIPGVPADTMKLGPPPQAFLWAAEPSRQRRWGAAGPAGGADPTDLGAGRRRRRRRRVGRAGGRRAGSWSSMSSRVSPRCCPPGGKRRSCPGRTAGERRRPAGAASSCVPFFSPTPAGSRSLAPPRLRFWGHLRSVVLGRGHGHWPRGALTASFHSPRVSRAPCHPLRIGRSLCVFLI